MPTKYILEVTMTGHVEEGDSGRWVAYNDEFGFITHGRTRNAAIKASVKALNLVIDTYFEQPGYTIAKLEKWFDTKGAEYKVRSVRRIRIPKRAAPTLEQRWGSVQRYSFKQRRQLAAAV